MTLYGGDRNFIDRFSISTFMSKTSQFVTDYHQSSHLYLDLSVETNLIDINFYSNEFPNRTIVDYAQDVKYVYGGSGACSPKGLDDGDTSSNGVSTIVTDPFLNVDDRASYTKLLETGKNSLKDLVSVLMEMNTNTDANGLHFDNTADDESAAAAATECFKLTSTRIKMVLSYGKYNSLLDNNETDTISPTKFILSRKDVNVNNGKKATDLFVNEYYFMNNKFESAVDGSVAFTDIYVESTVSGIDVEDSDAVAITGNEGNSTTSIVSLVNEGGNRSNIITIYYFQTIHYVFDVRNSAISEDENNEIVNSIVRNPLILKSSEYIDSLNSNTMQILYPTESNLSSFSFTDVKTFENVESSLYLQRPEPISGIHLIITPAIDILPKDVTSKALLNQFNSAMNSFIINYYTVHENWAAVMDLQVSTETKSVIVKNTDDWNMQSTVTFVYDVLFDFLSNENIELSNDETHDLIYGIPFAETSYQTEFIEKYFNLYVNATSRSISFVGMEEEYEMYLEKEKLEKEIEQSNASKSPPVGSDKTGVQIFGQSLWMVGACGIALILVGCALCLKLRPSRKKNRKARIRMDRFDDDEDSRYNDSTYDDGTISTRKSKDIRYGDENYKSSANSYFEDGSVYEDPMKQRSSPRGGNSHPHSSDVSTSSETINSLERSVNVKNHPAYENQQQINMNNNLELMTHNPHNNNGQKIPHNPHNINQMNRHSHRTSSCDFSLSTHSHVSRGGDDQSYASRSQSSYGGGYRNHKSDFSLSTHSRLPSVAESAGYSLESSGFPRSTCGGGGSPSSQNNRDGYQYHGNGNTVFQHRYRRQSNESSGYAPAFCMLDMDMKMNQAQFSRHMPAEVVESSPVLDKGDSKTNAMKTAAAMAAAEEGDVVIADTPPTPAITSAAPSAVKGMSDKAGLLNTDIFVDWDDDESSITMSTNYNKIEARLLQLEEQNNLVDRLKKLEELSATLSQASESNQNGNTSQTGSTQSQLSEQLLFDCFPRHIAEALRDGKKVEPESKDCVTIYFSDIVGFTDIASSLSDIKVSEMLDRLYNSFDALSHHHNVFKVETIGDAYMAVTNLDKDQHDHTKRIAEFAIDTMRVANQTMVDIDDPTKGFVKIRVGFHSGSVVANVVGTRNPRYCLFGDTVNTAARMESYSEENRIHCSAPSAELLRMQYPDIPLLSRGILDIKGKGSMTTFWVNEVDEDEDDEDDEDAEDDECGVSRIGGKSVISVTSSVSASVFSNILMNAGNPVSKLTKPEIV
eukprot:CAMPEP_0194374328 /NCGR_PEP_ID=MMETSP0174-20130528/22731_1 /TAXON_ID=216777 /ORGANISM="Proboscia alata, Strain PI-D3" /LENGTH=1257 /DNA_ID=CAMNT_0039153833 /DNA_START=389 /DNA_END=4163 /DNA_ORIENTATION=+